MIPVGSRFVEFLLLFGMIIRRKYAKAISIFVNVVYVLFVVSC